MVLKETQRRQPEGKCIRTTDTVLSIIIHADSQIIGTK